MATRKTSPPKGENDNPEKKPRPRSPRNGVELPIGRPFVQGEQQREISSRAGKKSAQVKRERKTLRNELLDLLSMPYKGEDGVERTQNESISIALIRQAMEGNVKAFETIRDTIGEKQKEAVEMSVALPQFEALDEAFDKMCGGKSD